MKQLRFMLDNAEFVFRGLWLLIIVEPKTKPAVLPIPIVKIDEPVESEQSNHNALSLIVVLAHEKFMIWFFYNTFFY